MRVPGPLRFTQRLLLIVAAVMLLQTVASFVLGLDPALLRALNRDTADRAANASMLRRWEHSAKRAWSLQAAEVTKWECDAIHMVADIAVG